MTALRQRDSVVIGRVRIRTSTADVIAAQQRFSQLLQTASLAPQSLPSSSLLCVRHLQDPAPQTQSLESSRVYLLPAWEQAVASSLERQASTALRPALESVPSGANAVLFMDDAELLAALASDWLSGTLSIHWWWRQVLKTFDSTAVFHQWTQSSESIPAALDQLRARQEDLRFVRKLPEPVSANLLRQMLHTHGIAAGRSASEQTDRVQPSDDLKPGRSASRQSEELLPTPPWSPWIPDLASPARFTASDELLVQALMLARARTVARSDRFQQALAEWIVIQSAHSRGPNEVADAASRNSSSRPLSTEPGPPDSTSARGAPLQADSIAPERTPKSVMRNSADASPTEITEHRHETPSASVCDRGNSREDKPRPQSIASGEVTEPPDLHPSTPRASVEEQTSTPVSNRELRALVRTYTSFGGVFFLLNAAILLGYYADFTAPLDPSLDLDIWDFLAVAGDRITGGGIRHDPLWETLAELAGRDPAEEPAWPEKDWIEATFNHLCGYLDDLLQIDSAAAFVCRLPSSFTCTPTHVDVFFSMHTHPIEIRKACLDRDPGWIPAAGRYVAFHFD